MTGREREARERGGERERGIEREGDRGREDEREGEGEGEGEIKRVFLLEEKPLDKRNIRFQW